MSPFVEQFRNLSTEYLLQRRALGDELSEEAHQAIELILSERGERIPPRPLSPILASDISPRGRNSNIAKTIALFVLAVVSMGLSKAIAHTWVGIVISIGVIAYVAINWIRRQCLPEAEREAEEMDRKAANDGLTSLMHAAAIRAVSVNCFSTVQTRMPLVLSVPPRSCMRQETTRWTLPSFSLTREPT
jgi:hypothetical protein